MQLVAFSNALTEDLIQFSVESEEAGDCHKCDQVKNEEYVMYWAGSLTFRILVDKFRLIFCDKGWPDISDSEITDGKVRNQWVDFHRRNAKLMFLCQKCHDSAEEAWHVPLLCEWDE